MYFVVVTGLPQGDESYISMIDTNSSKSAHSIAISEFRRVRDVPSNVHVRSVTAMKSESVLEASAFYNKLSNRIGELEAALESGE